MLIHEVCKLCSLTKKAVEYYEKQGLVRPEVGDNGYRSYSDKDVAVLKEIALLRRLGLGVPEIKKVLSSHNKPQTLNQINYAMELKKRRIAEQQQAIERLIDNYDVDQSMNDLRSGLDRALTIQEKLVQSFPGAYGMYLSMHFGRFLHERADRPEQEQAYAEIVDFLDNAELPTETEQLLEQLVPRMASEDIEQMEQAFLEALDDPERYMADHQDSLERYIAHRTSEEYLSSPAHQLRQALLEFQHNSGYDTFIANLKIVSPSYCEYADKLKKANELLLEKYPQMGQLEE